MVIGMRSLTLALLLAGGLTAPASADVIYSFVQTSFVGNCGIEFRDCFPPTVIGLDITVTDAAARNGFTVSTWQAQGPLDLSAFGVEQIVFSANGNFAIPNPFVTLATPTTNLPGGGVFPDQQLVPGWDISLTGDLTSIDGTVRFTGGAPGWGWSVIQFGFNPNGTQGGVGSTDVVGCSAYSGCGVTGYMTVTDTDAVPEPSSLALLAVGLAGLGMVLRTRRV
jgi:hypothetical protein